MVYLLIYIINNSLENNQMFNSFGYYSILFYIYICSSLYILYKTNLKVFTFKKF